MFESPTLLLTSDFGFFSSSLDTIGPHDRVEYLRIDGRRAKLVVESRPDGGLAAAVHFHEVYPGTGVGLTVGATCRTRRRIRPPRGRSFVRYAFATPVPEHYCRGFEKNPPGWPASADARVFPFNNAGQRSATFLS